MSSRKFVFSHEELVQGSEAWMEWRKGGIGASDAAILLGLSPWKSVADLYDIKTGAIKVEWNDAMRQGNRLEPKARDWWMRENDRWLDILCVIHPTKQFMRVSLDGITKDRSIIVEIKCPASLENHLRHTKNGTIIPAWRVPQLQYQLGVIREHFPNVERVDYVSYVEDGTPVVLPMYPDEKMIAELTRRAEIFYNCLITKQRPTPMIFEEDGRLVIRKRKKNEYESLSYPPQGNGSLQSRGIIAEVGSDGESLEATI